MPVADDLLASGVLAEEVCHVAHDEEASGVLELGLPELADCQSAHVDDGSDFLVLDLVEEAEFQSAQVEEPSAGLVEVVEHEVEVLVQTGTEIVHGQSVTVKVVLAVMV